MILAVFAERWLFFIEAKQAVVLNNESGATASIDADAQNN